MVVYHHTLRDNLLACDSFRLACNWFSLNSQSPVFLDLSPLEGPGSSNSGKPAAPPSPKSVRPGQEIVFSLPCRLVQYPFKIQPLISSHHISHIRFVGGQLLHFVLRLDLSILSKINWQTHYPALMKVFLDWQRINLVELTLRHKPLFVPSTRSQLLFFRYWCTYELGFSKYLVPCLNLNLKIFPLK